MELPPTCACIVALGDEPFLPLAVDAIYAQVSAVFFGVNGTTFWNNTPAPELVDTIRAQITEVPDPDNKIRVVTLDERGETDARNALLEHARGQGFDWSFIIDSDEVLDARNAAQLVRSAARWDPCVARVTIRHYWRSVEYVVQSLGRYSPVVLMHTSLKFHENRNVFTKHTHVVRDIVLHHLGFARPPDNMRARLGLNSHGAALAGWFERWRDDNPLTLCNAHPVWPTEFRRIVRSPRETLPAALLDMQ